MYNIDTIFEKVTNSADKYGFNNPQQWKQLLFSFQKSKEQDVFEALAKCFITKHTNNSIRQELAGRLLYELKPKASFDIHNIIKASLENFDLSVEHYLYYFIEHSGKNHIAETIANIDQEQLSKTELNALKTMEFWLKNYDSWLEQNNG